MINALEDLALTDLANILRLNFCETFQQGPEQEQPNGSNLPESHMESLNNNEIGFRPNDVTDNACSDCSFPEWLGKFTQKKFTYSDVLIRTTWAGSDLKVHLKTKWKPFN